VPRHIDDARPALLGGRYHFEARRDRQSHQHQVGARDGLLRRQIFELEVGRAFEVRMGGGHVLADVILGPYPDHFHRRVPQQPSQQLRARESRSPQQHDFGFGHRLLVLSWRDPVTTAGGFQRWAQSVGMITR
jgi:hypothetical protein